ncbi:MAG: hypothetical protein IPO92_19855 [Saprospiraceae bacterium]|nr:hypothetical protein [Saprospiraceae bacterium]
MLILSAIFQLIVFAIFGQEQSSFNYANLNSTSISAEFLDNEMILNTVDGNFDWRGSWRENNWYFFEFNQEIEINQIKLGFYDNTCLEDCKLEFQLITNDTIIELSIDTLKSIYKLKICSDNLLIKRKDVYPSGPGTSMK